MKLGDVNTIREVSTGTGYDDGRAPSAVREVNELLSDGWYLLAIHQRMSIYPGEDSRACTVYILGHRQEIREGDARTEDR